MCRSHHEPSLEFGEGRTPPGGLKAHSRVSATLRLVEGWLWLLSSGGDTYIPESLGHRFLSMQPEGHSSFPLISASSPGERCEQS